MFSREINDDEIIKLIWTFLFNNEGCMLLYVAAAVKAFLTTCDATDEA